MSSQTTLECRTCRRANLVRRVSYLPNHPRTDGRLTVWCEECSSYSTRPRSHIRYFVDRGPRPKATRRKPTAMEAAVAGLAAKRAGVR